jgi:hypothetical protein
VKWKKQARAEGRDYTEDDKQADIEVAKLKYPFEGRYVIDALGNVQPLKDIMIQRAIEDLSEIDYNISHLNIINPFTSKFNS